MPAALVLVVYFVQETDCGAKDVRNNLQEWVRNRITEYDEKCGVLWGEMLRIVHSCISGLEGQISDDTYSYLARSKRKCYCITADETSRILKKNKIISIFPK